MKALLTAVGAFAPPKDSKQEQVPVLIRSKRSGVEPRDASPPAGDAEAVSSAQAEPDVCPPPIHKPGDVVNVLPRLWPGAMAYSLYVPLHSSYLIPHVL